MSSMRAATSSNLTRVRAAAPITKTRMARGGETSNDNSARYAAPFRLGLVMSPPDVRNSASVWTTQPAVETEHHAASQHDMLQQRG
jgi:hypothetical protein